MDLDELIQKYNRTVRAPGLLRYMLEADHGLTGAEAVESGTAVGVPRISSMEAPKDVVLFALRTRYTLSLLLSLAGSLFVLRSTRSACCLRIWLRGR